MWQAPEQLRSSLTVYFVEPYLVCGSDLNFAAWQPAQSGLYDGVRHVAASVLVVWQLRHVSATR